MRRIVQSFLRKWTRKTESIADALESYRFMIRIT